MAKEKMQKEWQLKPVADKDFIENFPEINPIVRQILFNRNIDTQEKIDEFLHPDYLQDLHDPYLFRDMKKAADRIWQAIDKKEKVVVYGDYDADGVCSSALLTDFLQQAGLEPGIYIPHRETEAYGLNMNAIENFIEKGIDLVITVDCGTTNVAEVEMAKKSGLDIIVVDHHHVPEERVEPYAFLNCADEQDDYPFKYLAAVGMVFKLVQGLIKRRREKNKDLPFNDGQEKWFLDLVAIATVTDIVPMIGENHTLVKYGMMVLNKTRRLGLRELIKLSGLQFGKIETWHLGFVIGPRLNAAGRIDHANTAFTLLMADKQADAVKYAEDLNKANVKRQQLTEQFVKEAKVKVQEQIENGDNILVAFDSAWDLGVVGLIAGKLAEQYNRPVLAITENQGKIMGSGRSIPSFDLIQAIEKQAQFLLRFGGHKQACGFTVKDQGNLEKFHQALKKYAKSLKLENTQPVLWIDAKVSLAEINWSLYDDLKKLEPYGEKNFRPRFLSQDLHIVSLDFVGDKKQHLRLTVGDDLGNVKKIIAFGFGEIGKNLQISDKIDIVYELGLNEWNGNRELQLKLVDFKIN